MLPGKARPAFQLRVRQSQTLPCWVVWRAESLARDVEIYVPFRSNHEDTRERQLKKSVTTIGVEDGAGLESTPGSVCFVRGRHPCDDDQEEESQPVGDRQRYGATQHSEGGIVDQDHIQGKIDRPEDDQDQSRRAHDAYRQRWGLVFTQKKARRLTLALQVFLERFKGDEPWGSKNEHSHDVLYVFAELGGFADSQEDGFHVKPQHGDGDEEGPQEHDTSLKMYGQIGLAAAARERL